MNIKSVLVEGPLLGAVESTAIDIAIAKVIGNGEYVNHTVAAGHVTILGLTVHHFVYLTVIYREKSAE